jgi:hypothetical protein
VSAFLFPNRPTNERKRIRPWQSRHYHNHKRNKEQALAYIIKPAVFSSEATLLQEKACNSATAMRTSQARADKRNMMKFVILSSTLMAGGALTFQTPVPLLARQTPSSAVTPIHRTASSQNWSTERKPRQIYHAMTWQQGTSEDNSSVSLEDTLTATPYPTPDHDEITTVDKAVLAGTTAFTAISLFAFITLSAPGSWRYFLAGGICAAMSHAVTVPIDVVKVSGRRF